MVENPIIKEACVETYQEALNAQNLKANRIELCSKLSLGGLTPSTFQIKESIKRLTIPIKVMVRCRAGNFNYTNKEIDKMLIDIKKIKRLGIKEIVLGALDRNNSIDLNLMQVFSNEASPMSITFHKAIDFTYDIKNEIKKLSKFKNVKSILTSGGATTAEKGKNKLKEIIDTFEGRFHVIIAGSVTKNNLNELHAFIKGKEYHGRKIV